MPALHVETPPSVMARRAKQAMADYKAGIAGEENGRQRAIAAVIAYGRALIEGQMPFGKNKKAFGQWIKAEELDQGDPWNVRAERSNAMEIARLSNVGSVPTLDFTSCPYTRPIDIMKWYRAKTNPKSDKPKTKTTDGRSSSPGGPALAKATAAIQEMEAAGIPLTEPGIIARAGVADGTANKALALHRKEQEVTEKTLQRVAEDQIIAASLTPKQKLKLADAIRIHQKRLDKAFEARVDAEVQLRIKTANAYALERLKSVEAQLAGVERMLARKGVFSTEDFNLIMKCLDSGTIAFRLKDPDPELVRRFDAAMMLVRNNKVSLVNPAKK